MASYNDRGEALITQPGPLHDDRGWVAQTGYATRPLLRYDRRRVDAAPWRIKEWDYYLVNDGSYAVALTLSDLGYIGLLSASVMDFERKSYVTTSELTLLPLGRFRMPADSGRGLAAWETKRVSMIFEVTETERWLRCTFKRFDGDRDLAVDVTLDQEPRDSMVIVTPWKERIAAFYYNRKIPAMRARGSLSVGDLVHDFKPNDSFGLLDWGRGVWTRDNTWFWAAAQGMQNGRRFGLNLGYGFGDTRAASENMVVVDGVAHKLGRVDFGIPEGVIGPAAGPIEDRYDLLKPWHITDNEGRLDLVFSPDIDRADCMDYKLVSTDQHQVFGLFNGSVVLDNGERFEIRDLRGSAEVVHNVY